jgi:multiple sugar transport system substrate-binding protein
VPSRNSGWTRARLIRLAAAVVAGALALVACGGGSGDQQGGTGGPTKITFSYLWAGKEAAAIEQLIAQFNAGQKDVVVKGVSNPDVQAQLTSMSSSRGTFDISDSFGSNVGAWASKGILEPLDSYIAKDHYDLADFVRPALEQMKYQDQTYALPIAVHSIQLLYNKDLLAKAGISGPPKTASEFATAIRATTVVKDGKINQLGWANPDLTTMAYAFGGDWFDGSGKPTPDQPANVAAAQFYVDNVVTPYGAKNVQKFTSGFGEYASPQNPFFQGKVAMVTDGEWMSAFAKQYAPKLNWGVAPLPHADGRDDLAGSTQATNSTLFIPRNSRHKDAAWTFLKFMLDKKAMLDFTHTLANLPARQSLLDSGAFADLPQFDGWLKSLQSDKVHVFSSVPVAQQYVADLEAARDEITRGVKPPAAAFAEVARKAKSYG